jgi:CheY-like chemotaxis protein
MSGDLVSLRMLVISDLRPMRELWRKAVALASIPIEFSEMAGDAVRLSGGPELDIVLIDAAVAESTRKAALKALRDGNSAPLVAVVAPDGAAPLEGVDRQLRKPDSVEEAAGLVERCIRMRIPTRVLIVDDSGTMRSIVRKILSATRYVMEFVEAEQGIDALKRLGANNVDVVLLDYNMPGFDGLETLAEIKRRAPRVAVVMMTSTVDEAVAERARAAGAAGFLKKPFYPADVDALLDRIYAGPGR